MHRHEICPNHAAFLAAAIGRRGSVPNRRPFVSVLQSSAFPDDPAALQCYLDAFRALKENGVEFLVGGAYSLARYTDIPRHTKDMDLFLRRRDRDAALAALASAGYRTEVTYPHWLAKGFRGEYLIDLIDGSGNGVAVVDDHWFEFAVEDTVLGEPVLLCPAEETIWSKAFIMERHRYDGADIAHILRAVGDRLDWRRLLDRFGPYWRVLFSHLVLFGFVYPRERANVPAWVLGELADLLREEAAEDELGGAGAAADRVCRGTLLAGLQYVTDIEKWGYRDPRLAPEGAMTPDDVAQWTDGIATGR